MRAICLTRPGDPEVMHLIESPTPTPNAGEVTIDVEIAV